MPYSVSPTFFTPYDALASSSCSALINSLGCLIGFMTLALTSKALYKYLLSRVACVLFSGLSNSLMVANSLLIYLYQIP